MDYYHLRFSELNFLVEFILIRYKKHEMFFNLPTQTIKEKTEPLMYDNFCSSILEALSCLNEEEYRIFYNDYLAKSRRYWWQEYYSKSSYYRIKKKAMLKFLNCLHS